MILGNWLANLRILLSLREKTISFTDELFGSLPTFKAYLVLFPATSVSLNTSMIISRHRHLIQLVIKICISFNWVWIHVSTAIVRSMLILIIMLVVADKFLFFVIMLFFSYQWRVREIALGVWQLLLLLNETFVYFARW